MLFLPNLGCKYCIFNCYSFLFKFIWFIILFYFHGLFEIFFKNKFNPLILSKYTRFRKLHLRRYLTEYLLFNLMHFIFDIFQLFPQKNKAFNLVSKTFFHLSFSIMLNVIFGNVDFLCLFKMLLKYQTNNAFDNLDKLSWR